ncbi:hypothetical protein [Streptomyces sp. NPDC127084]|uniref:hypothetical protein n=1 Tax=Streptomyces sp. NPDC127084 TaxID=3347133 RepID=UPI0036545BAB
MSESMPPPSGNPFATDAATAAPAPAPAPARDNVALGLVAAVVAALVAAGAYGGIAGAIDREIGYAAIGVGFLVGFAAAKAGGRNPVLPVVSAVLSIGAVYAGQLLAIAIIFGKELKISVTEVLFDDFGMVTEVWGLAMGFMDIVFFALAAFAAFGGAKKA